jgi:hypothetical protein
MWTTALVVLVVMAASIPWERDETKQKPTAQKGTAG